MTKVYPTSLKKSKTKNIIKDDSINTDARTRGCVDGDSCNPYLMQDSNSHFGFDTISFQARIENRNDSLFDALKELKENLQDSDTKSEVPFEFEKGSPLFCFNLHRVGIKFFPYHLSCGDIHIFLANRDSSSHLAGLKVEVGSMSSQMGVRAFYDRLVKWFRFYHVDVVSNIVSRADLAVDLFDHKITDSTLWNDDHYITRAASYDAHKDSVDEYQKQNKTSLHKVHRKVTGVSIGRGSVMLRMYDKSGELDKPHNCHKKLFFHRLWSSSSSDVTRVEFQLRRKFLGTVLEFGDIDDLCKNVEKIWSYLTKEWFRHCEDVVDSENNHQGRSVVSEDWERVVSGGCSGVDVNPCERILKKPVQVSVKALKAQVRGLALTLCAAVGHEVDDFQGMLSTSIKLFCDEIQAVMANKTVFEREFKIRQNRCYVSF